MKPDIFVPLLSKNQTDAAFYYGEQIGIVEHNNKIYSIESRGELEVIFKGSKYKGEMAQKELISLNYTDKKYNKLLSEDKVCLNNWFALIEVDKNGNCISDDLSIMHDYTQCIEVLNNISEFVD